MRVAATIQLSLGVLVRCSLALIFREPIQDNLLRGNTTLYWILVGTVLAYAASYFARGFFAGSRRFGLYAGLLLAESISRTLFALAVAIGIASGQSAVAAGIIAAPCFSLIVVPFAFSRRAATQPRPRGARGPGTEGAGPEFTLAHGGGFAAAVLLIMFSEQTFLNAGPLLIKGHRGRRRRRASSSTS